MEAFYVTIIFLGVLLVIVSLFLIVMDRVNGKDFFKEFDRKKDEMFNLIQDSEEMVQELNRMSDYVITVISEKNKELLNKNANLSMKETSINVENSTYSESVKLVDQIQEKSNLPIAESTQKLNQVSMNSIDANQISIDKPERSKIVEEIVPQNEESDVQRLDFQFSYKNNMNENKTQDTSKFKLTLNTRRKEVLQMIELGFNNDEISDKLRIGKGEIEFIRGLSK